MLRNFTLIRLPSTGPIQALGARLLYTEEALNLPSYVESRERAKLQFHTPQMQEKFRDRMKELIHAQSSNLVFSDDLKNMIHLATDSPEDLELLNGMTERLNQQSSGFKFSAYSFGPVIMRYLYHFDKPEEALKMLRNPSTVAIFHQYVSYQIAMDLMMKHKMYDAVMETFSICRDRCKKSDRYPQNCFVLATNALYCQNTPEACEKMIELFRDAQEFGHFPMRRAITFAAALFINQGHYDKALDLLNNCYQQNYVTIRNLKVIALSKTQRLSDAFTILRICVDYDTPEARKRSVYKEVVEVVRERVNASDDHGIRMEFNRIENALIAKELIEDMSVDSALTAPIEKIGLNGRNWGNPDGGQSLSRGSTRFNYDRSQRNQRKFDYPRTRPSLSEME